jgi:hypothetical protein
MNIFKLIQLYGINTRNTHHFHRPIANLSCFQKSAYLHTMLASKFLAIYHLVSKVIRMKSTVLMNSSCLKMSHNVLKDIHKKHKWKILMCTLYEPSVYFLFLFLMWKVRLYCTHMFSFYFMTSSTSCSHFWQILALCNVERERERGACACVCVCAHACMDGQTDGFEYASWSISYVTGILMKSVVLLAAAMVRGWRILSITKVGTQHCAGHQLSPLF